MWPRKDGERQRAHSAGAKSASNRGKKAFGISRKCVRASHTVRDRELQTFDHPHPCSGFLF
jgi:hypothetical protein